MSSSIPSDALQRSGATLCDETLVFRDIRRPTSGNEYRFRVSFSFEFLASFSHLGEVFEIIALSRALRMGEGARQGG